MSTDIGALEKQYAKLRRKQHHACVVISGIKPGPGDTDSDVKLERETPDSPNKVEITDDDNQVEGSVAMLTLSVPLETEKYHRDLTDPIPPTIFGDTKCFFVQNLKKKKTKEKHHTKHSKRTDKHGNSISVDNSETIEDGEDSKPHHNDKAAFNCKKKGKTVCFSDEIKAVNESEPEDKASAVNNIQEEEISTENDNEVKGGQDTEHQFENKDNLEGNNTSTEEICINKVSKENGNIESKADTESEDTSLNRVEQIEAASGNNTNKTVKNITEPRAKLEDEHALDADSIDTSTELHSNVLKTSRTQGLRNPAVKYSKQYYPSSHIHISRKKQRTNSERAESTNKQSIYQHFTMTKRQLSLDSALSVECNKAMPAKTLDFPFPVHSINEHKIKAGMKLGLYDQKALEKLEKSRKIPKTKLPSLTHD